MKFNADEPLVSIITPVYNAESFLEDTFNSVMSQKYQNWEWILVDDVSSDNSLEVIKRLQLEEPRIKIIQNQYNMRAANSRNIAVKAAKGRFIAFLDADDFWTKNKLADQIRFMLDKHHIFTYTSYEFADSKGMPSGKVVLVPNSIKYADALKKSPIFTSTVVIDTSKVDEAYLMMPNYTVGEDTAMWWGLLKRYGSAHGIKRVNSYYRRGGADTLSANKIKAAKWRWFLYRSHEKMTVIKSAFYFTYYIKYAVERRV